MIPGEVEGILLAPRQPPELDVAGMAENALAKALERLALRMGLDRRQAAASRLQQGDRLAWDDFYYELARQVAEQLGTANQDIKAAYIDEYDVNTEDLAFGEAARTTVIDLIAWAEHKKDSFKPLVTAFDRALVRSYMDLIGVPRLTHLLEVHVIDDADAKNPAGYGRWLYSDHFCLTELWRRAEANLEL
jgi:hypothetical protein